MPQREAEGVGSVVHSLEYERVPRLAHVLERQLDRGRAHPGHVHEGVELGGEALVLEQIRLQLERPGIATQSLLGVPGHGQQSAVAPRGARVVGVLVAQLGCSRERLVGRAVGREGVELRQGRVGHLVGAQQAPRCAGVAGIGDARVVVRRRRPQSQPEHADGRRCHPDPGAGAPAGEGRDEARSPRQRGQGVLGRGPGLGGRERLERRRLGDRGRGPRCALGLAVPGLEGLADAGGVGESSVALLGHHRLDDGSERGRHALGQRRRLARDLHAEQHHDVVGLEGQPPREHLIEDDPRGVDVGALVDRAARGLLGAHVARGPEHHAEPRHLLVVAPAPSAIFAMPKSTSLSSRDHRGRG